MSHRIDTGNPTLQGETVRLALLVEYNGSKYHGFQYQKNVASIQGTIENAVFSLTGEPTRIKGAGRTDSGAHAIGQVVAFDTNIMYNPLVFTRAINSYLPQDIVIKETVKTNISFDPRRDAIKRWYKFKILNNPIRSPLFGDYTYNFRGDLDIESMRIASNMLEGTRNFAPFSGALSEESMSTIRNMFEVTVTKDSDLVEFDFVANAFLPQQVRRMAGALVDVGSGKLMVDEFYKLANSNTLGAANKVLDAKALYLMNVEYAVPIFEIQNDFGVWEEALIEANTI